MDIASTAELKSTKKENKYTELKETEQREGAKQREEETQGAGERKL